MITWVMSLSYHSGFQVFSQLPEFRLLGVDFGHFWDQCKSVEKINCIWGGGVWVKKKNFLAKKKTIFQLSFLFSDSIENGESCLKHNLGAVKPPKCQSFRGLRFALGSAAPTPQAATRSLSRPHTLFSQSYQCPLGTLKGGEYCISPPWAP